MVRRRKVMKVKTRKGTERWAATALRQIKRHSMYKGKGRTDSSKCKSCSGFDECLSFYRMPNTKFHQMGEIIVRSI